MCVFLGGGGEREGEESMIVLTRGSTVWFLDNESVLNLRWEKELNEVPVFCENDGRVVVLVDFNFISWETSLFADIRMMPRHSICSSTDAVYKLSCCQQTPHFLQTAIQFSRVASIHLFFFLSWDYCIIQCADCSFPVDVYFTIPYNTI